MPDVDREQVQSRTCTECSPCLEKYGLEEAVKKLGQAVLRPLTTCRPTCAAKVLGRLDLIRSGQTVPDHDVTATPQES
ncbi:Mycothiol system anti-sigma-R factor OS=Streptomyces alboniger OX=132473 GN=CP975_23765 PE=4 SV=1 [Streptomyces alboniger]